MEPLVVFGSLAALLALWTWFLHVRSDGRMWSPLWMAFTCTAFGALLLIAGSIGFTLSRHERFVSGTRWADDVIWWQVWSGVGVAVLAVYFWRRALRETSFSHLPRARGSQP